MSEGHLGLKSGSLNQDASRASVPEPESLQWSITGSPVFSKVESNTETHSRVQGTEGSQLTVQTRSQSGQLFESGFRKSQNLSETAVTEPSRDQRLERSLSAQMYVGKVGNR